MKNYLKIFAPVGLAILIGSLTFIAGQTKTPPDGQFPNGDRSDFGRPGPPSFGFAPDGLNPRLLDRISLTDEQKKQVRTLEDAARSSSEVYFEKLIVVQEKIKDTTEGESFDEAAARRLLKTKGELETELTIIRLKTGMAVYNLLTAEQIALLKQERPEFPPQDGFRPPVPPQEK
jgi:Spy/CpxP family protein refolding chaperone